MKNIFQRISDVMADVSYLTKDDAVETGGGKSYKAITEEKVTSTVRASLIKNGIVILPISQTAMREDERVLSYDRYQKKDVEKINRVTTVNVTYRVQNVDDRDDFITVQSTGTGVDTQDKGIGKAMTYAYKYMLLRTFGIPTGEDPDKISSDIYTAKLTGEADRKPAEKPAKDVGATDEEFQLFVDNESAKDDEPCTKIQIAMIERACTSEQVEAICKSRKVKALGELTAVQAAGIIKGLEKKGMSA